MDISHATSSPAEAVEVRVRSSPSLISAVRVVAADLAARADFDLDAVSDLRMAVDEACSALVAVATPDTVLRCRFGLGTDHILATATVVVSAPTKIRQDTFGWRVLSTLADSAEVIGGQDGGQPWIGIRLRKDRTTT